MSRLTRCAGLPWIASLALLAGSARAGTLFADPYGVGAPDVLGNPADFDIRSLEVQDLSPANLQINLRLNYHGGDASLAAFTEDGSSFASVAVGLGDVLIQGHSSLWAVPLSSSGPVGGPGGIYGYAAAVPVAQPMSRIQLLPGSLYRVTGALTAGQVLGVSPAADLRADEPVWGQIDNFTPDFQGYFPIAYGVGGSEIAIQLQIAIGPAFYDDVSNGYSVHFASTTCACDVLDGAVPEAPAAALALVGIALALACARRTAARAVCH